MGTNIRILFEKLAKQHCLAHAHLFSGNDSNTKNHIITGFLEDLRIEAADQIRVEPAEKEISITQIRDLIQFLSLSAWNSPYKVAIIQNAETMNREAQSAFLKLLEEPKGNTVLFLITKHPQVLLDTIRSRCQEFRFYAFEPFTIPEETKKEFGKLQKANLHTRFAYAKKLADTPEEIAQTLQFWIALLRQSMVENTKTNANAAHAFAQKIKTAQEILHILQTTNANPRLAVERLLLDM
ncbi:MAG TPA: hypothetical protein VGA53_02775 [Candidatus Paceibacterota bacterium]